MGEIWVRGESVAAGYWAKPAETDETFRAFTAGSEGPFLRTGDLGFMTCGHLFVTGRHKDLIIIRGRNHYPQDIEDSVSTSHPALVPHACAAFSIEIEQGERARDRPGGSAQRASDAGRRVAWYAPSAAPYRSTMPCIRTPSCYSSLRTLPRTTSGKVRRKACREAFLENSLPAVATWLSAVAAPPGSGASRAPNAPSAQADRLIEWLRHHAADLINAHASEERRKSPTPLLRDLAKQGLLGMQVDPAYGGLGLGNSDTVRVLEQLGAIDFTLALFVGRNNSLGIQPIARHARIPNQGAPAARARPGARARSLRLRGAFRSPSAERARRARGVGRRRPLAALRDQVPRRRRRRRQHRQRLRVITTSLRASAPSSSRTARPACASIQDSLSMGLLGFARDTIALDGVGVGRENLLGSLGSGLDVAREAIMHSRLAIAAACIGGMKRCAQLVGRDGPYYGTINGTLTPNPVMLSRLGSVTASITALECLVRRIARAIDTGYAVPAEAFAACKILAPELLLRCVDDLMRLSIDGRSVETIRLSRLHRDAGLLRNVDGPPEALAELTGAVVMEDESSLRRLVEDVLHAPTAAARFDEAIEAVRQRMTNLSGALARRAQRWGHTRAGELAAWVVLLAAVDGSRQAAPSAELERAHAWAHAQFQHALSAVRFGTPSETATLDTSDVAATFAAYAHTIGDSGAGSNVPIQRRRGLRQRRPSLS